MKQRACIAIAICLRPRVIIADEPTSALDVVVQRHVMETLETLRADLGASVILIGHDMGLMAQAVDRLGVMYAGDLVETGGIQEIFDDPLHPYTRLLMASLPSLEQKETARGIPGLTPSLLNRPPGCPFHPRCPDAFDRCKVNAPKLQTVRPNRDVACHLHEANGTGGEVS
jgi:peptide/nickel transport system ATP-binding protein